MLWQRFTEASPSRLRGLLCWVPGLLKCFFKTMMQYRNSLHRDILNISLTFIIPQINTLTLTINLFSHYHWWIFFFFFLKHAISQVSSWGDIITRWWVQGSLSTAVTHTRSAMSCFLFCWQPGRRMWVSSCMWMERHLLQEQTRVVSWQIVQTDNRSGWKYLKVNK